MNRWLATILGLVLMHAGNVLAGSEQSAAESIASIASSMDHGLRLYAQNRGRPAEQLSEEERSVLLNELRRLKIHRASLLTYSAGLKPNSYRAREIAKFVARWQNDEALEDGLLSAPTLRDSLDAGVRRLMRIFPENNWHTPFPLFRP